jgi:hypothetical protein
MAWLTTMTKLAPYLLQLGEIGVSALPHFTRRKPEAAAPVLEPEDRVTQQQIAELQAAATQNAAHIRELASDLTEALAAIEVRLRRAEVIAYIALAVAISAILLTAIFWAVRM